MRAVVQRIAQAYVTVNDKEIARVGKGILILLGIGQDDTDEDTRYLANKIANLRVFEDEDGKINKSVLDVGGQALVVPNFTIYGDCRKGLRPSFTYAAKPELANALYQLFCKYLAGEGLSVQSGAFQTQMQVSLINDGPVTLLLDSRKTF